MEWPKFRTGNGTINNQNLYCMVNLPWFWCWKIGVTGGSPGKRAKSINKKIRRGPFGFLYGWFVPLTWINIYFAYNIEQQLLDITSFAQITVFGRGGTEIRFIIPGILFYVTILVAAICKNYGKALVFMIGPFVLLFLAFKYLLEI